MQLSSFDYEYPSDLIAHYPVSPRDQCRLLVIARNSGSLSHTQFFRISEYLRPGDLLIINNSRVMPARLTAHLESGGLIEILLLNPIDGAPLVWNCLARPGRKIRQKIPIFFQSETKAHIHRIKSGELRIQWEFTSSEEFTEWLRLHGKIPLPPYIRRQPIPEDHSNYQTVYADPPGSVAAPTAGLHFSLPLLQDLVNKGVLIEAITLHIGYGTFSPIRCSELSQHPLHSERYEISPYVALQMCRAKKEGRRIIAVGTSVMRAMESMESIGPKGSTNLFIQPGHRFRWADCLITNFHLPKSSLYVLVASFLGLELTRKSYQAAISERYRFFSYGDAMAIF